MANTQSSIDKAIQSNSEGDVEGILKAITIGRRDQISQNLRDIFSRTGVAHLLSISGLHVGYVALAVFLMVRLFLALWPRISFIWPAQRIAALASLPFVWLYVAVAGFPVSAVRAGIMLTTFLFALFFLWRRDLISALATAVFVILIVSPASLFSTSFQLSAVSVLAIIVFTPVIIEKLKGRFCGLTSVVAVTIAATLGSAPLVAYYFHFVSAVGIAANIVAVPFAGVVLMPLVMLASVVTIIHSASGIYLWKLAALAASFLMEFVKFIDQHATSFVFSWAPSIMEVLFAYAAIALIIFWRRIPYKRFAASALITFFTLDIIYWHIVPIVNRELEVTFLDVAHGDSIVVRFPNNHITLIDGGGIKGGDFDVGRHVVSPALLRMGIHRVDDLILTHPHYDHYKGLASIAENFKPHVLYTNSASAPEEESAEWQDFLLRVRASGVPIKTVSTFSTDEGGVNMTIFAPKSDNLNMLDPNNTSLVVRLAYKNKSFLVVGDLMNLGERVLLEDGVPLASDVFKVGHHGSETSTSAEFLEVVKPKIAVISVAKNDRYGVPDQVVLSRLGEAGAEIRRTDLDGMIQMKTDGTSLDVSTYVK